MLVRLPIQVVNCSALTALFLYDQQQETRFCNGNLLRKLRRNKKNEQENHVISSLRRKFEGGSVRIFVWRGCFFQSVIMAETSPQPQTSTGVAAACPGPTSPPPNCAICLGNCRNKCFSDSCMHQFCFQCLLEWSKVKAVCPLCKQPFTSIIHNVKSNNEYDEHIIAGDPVVADDDFEDHFIVRTANHQVERILPAHHDFYLPTMPHSSRHFQFRTTFTVDPRGELAIQQLLSTHPLTNSIYEYITPSYINRCRRSSRDVSSSGYRRSIYDQNLWVNALPDLSGRYREISPQFYSENQAARNRLVPWLNRELNVLLNENTQHVMFVVDVILTQLARHHIRSRYFKQLLQEYLGSRTDHFIHEFYNFMRSPYDMVGYDRYVLYASGAPSQFNINISDDDEDEVAVVGESREEPVVIEINSDSSRDSDVIIQEPAPPVVVEINSSEESAHTKFPPKIRLKAKKRKTKREMVSSFSDSDSSAERVKLRKKKIKRKNKPVFESSSDSSASVDAVPILSRLQRQRGLEVPMKHEVSSSESSYTPPLPAVAKEEVFYEDADRPGPSGSAAVAGSDGDFCLVHKRWYLRPAVYSSEDSSD